MSEQCPGCASIIPQVWENQIPDEVYLIVQNRRDATQPKLCKTYGMRMHATLEDAEEALAKIPDDVRGYEGIYRAHVVVLDRIK